MSEVGSGEEARAELRRMALGFMPAQILHAAARLGVADAIADGATEVGDIAVATDADPDALHRLLRGLAGLGVVRETGAGGFELAELGQPLRADHPGSLRSMVLLFGDEMVWRAWGALPHTVRTGETAFDHVAGEGTFEYFARHPELSEIFNRAMVAGTRRIAADVADAYDFSRFGTVVDVGGGNGALIAAVLSATPRLQGILFDTPEGIGSARELLGDAGVADRCRVETGDFFEDVPGGDVLVLKSIVHDWDYARATAILRNCRRALADGGRLLLLEPVLPERVDTAEAARIVMSDINMLVNTGGRERTADQFRTLLGAAGFDLVDVTPPVGDSQLRIIEAAPS